MKNKISFDIELCPENTDLISDLLNLFQDRYDLAPPIRRLTAEEAKERVTRLKDAWNKMEREEMGPHGETSSGGTGPTSLGGNMFCRCGHIKSDHIGGGVCDWKWCMCTTFSTGADSGANPKGSSNDPGVGELPSSE